MPTPAPGVVRLAGLAGLIAGAFSMASGEYISMKGQAELLERELELEEREIQRHPEAERRELAAIYRQRGMTAEVADELANEMMRDPELALEAHAREELGIDPSQLGSPRQAAVSSFVAFCVGALVPLLPWFFAAGNGAVVASIVLGALAAIAGRRRARPLHRAVDGALGAPPARDRRRRRRRDLRGRARPSASRRPRRRGRRGRP